MLPFFGDYLNAKNMSDPFGPSSYIDGQRILQSDWLGAFLAITEEPDFCRIMKNCNKTIKGLNFWKKQKK